ncbi:hypothetical protein CcaverHIS002_0401070 [Cutaneotrichosporon cavernicola]|uniref:ChrR-like cupin domain-containing protein n=1 Tax=Cutaneotrichosporon cavernicola TaxID=279322 RepID=A0AA48L3H8_9TREE|nr:uncharacterized protein CcaverHIS019_0401040 [Cutaneotrichosporon cavernicola]BEI83503.1 hypothetical protein CcaverHIS002_0401070 [Cutaneotrichosporon cavernicola]BEI91284.1 hypothetical protein CcaverHIS019_0401040 [Cutaneotrichosporon cavernicola]BEI99057.1 hypothetical protein CcaverHIS631_0401000 [Cutaneotrichosporon cavernicola]BEJ06831.1 hypothetical protein CcaverHIS641_0401000 [Cutaneotrichosporon cavernicola]
MVKNGSQFHMAMDVKDTKTPWADVTDKILSYDPDTKNVTKLQVYAPGWKQGHGTYAHNYWEEILVVSGKIYDHTIERWVGPGEYACRPPGQKHGPFECGPDEGAVVLLVNTSSWPKE